MMTAVDLEPAARRVAELVRAVPDDLLDAPTPNPGNTLGDLLDHVGGLTLAFTAAAKKDFGDATSQGPSGDASRLAEDWRTRIPQDLAALAEAWRDPAAWSGMTQAGGARSRARSPVWSHWTRSLSTGGTSLAPADSRTTATRPCSRRCTPSSPSSRSRGRKRRAQGCSGPRSRYRRTRRCSNVWSASPGVIRPGR